MIKNVDDKLYSFFVIIFNIYNRLLIMENSLRFLEII